MEIVANTIGEAWEQSIEALLDNSLPLGYTQRGERARELLGVQLVVAHPLDEPIIPKTYLFGNLFIEDYCNNILCASNGGPSINSRIVKKRQIESTPNDQIKKVVNLLKKEPNSRRALICLWNAENDISSHHPPCACTIQFLIRGGRLDTIAYFRSNDSWMAALPDMIAITKLSQIISNKINISIGKYIHFAASYHLYEPDIVPALYAFERYQDA